MQVEPPRYYLHLYFPQPASAEVGQRLYRLVIDGHVVPPGKPPSLLEKGFQNIAAAVPPLVVVQRVLCAKSALCLAILFLKVKQVIPNGGA